MSGNESASDAFAREMARREIVFHRPTPCWQNGLSVGNGDLGGAVFGGGKETDGVIGVALSKVDVWDERYDRKGRRVHTLAELRELVAEHADTEEGRKKLNSLEPYGLVAEPGWHQKTYPYAYAYAPPTPKPLGVVRLDPGTVLEEFESRLSIHRGEVTFTLAGARGEASVNAFIDADSSVLAVRIERRGEYEIRRRGAARSKVAVGEDGEGPTSYEGPSYWGDVPAEKRLAVWLGLPE